MLALPIVQFLTKPGHWEALGMRLANMCTMEARSVYHQAEETLVHWPQPAGACVWWWDWLYVVHHFQ